MSSSSTQNKRKLSHASRACDACRRRKAKCDERRPVCSMCDLHHEECVFGSQRDRRRTPFGRVTALENRLKELERRHQGEQGKDGGSSSGQETTTEDNQRESHGHGTTSLTGAAREGDNSEWFKASVLAMPIQRAEECYELKLRTRWQIDHETGDLKEYGPSSAFRHLTDEFHGSSPSASTQPDASRSSVGVSPPLRSALDSGDPACMVELQYPPCDEILHDQLVRMFFSYFNIWGNWIDEVRFRANFVNGHGLRTLLTKAERSAYYSPLLHNALLAVSVSFLDSEEFPKRRGIGHTFMRRARDLLDEEAEHPALSTVAGAMLLGAYHSGAGRHSLGFVYAGIGLRLVQHLGLAVDCRKWVERGYITDDMRRARDRVFYKVYIQDKLWSSYVGRSISIRARHGCPEVPGNLHEEDETLWRPHTYDIGNRLALGQPSWSGSVFEAASRLAIIAEDVLDTVYTYKFDTSHPRAVDNTHNIYLELDKWHSGLYGPLQVDPALSPTTPHKVPPPGVLTLQIMYSFLVILLLRPWYITSERLSSMRKLDAVVRCDEAAFRDRISQLLALFAMQPGLRYAPISLTQMTFVAGTVYLLKAARETNRRTKAADSAFSLVSKCVSSLMEMGITWECARQSGIILHRLLQHWIPAKKVAVPSPASDEHVRAQMSSKDIRGMLANPEFVATLRQLGWSPPEAGALSGSEDLAKSQNSGAEGFLDLTPFTGNTTFPSESGASTSTAGLSIEALLASCQAPPLGSFHEAGFPFTFNDTQNRFEAMPSFLDLLQDPSATSLATGIGSPQMGSPWRALYSGTGAQGQGHPQPDLDPTAFDSTGFNIGANVNGITSTLNHPIDPFAQGSERAADRDRSVDPKECAPRDDQGTSSFELDFLLR